MLGGLAPVAFARKPQIRIDHIDASNCSRTGRVKITATDVELEGVVRKRPKKNYRLLVDGESAGGPLPDTNTPQVAPTPAANDAGVTTPTIPMELGIVVQLTASYSDSIKQIREGLFALVNRIPGRSRVSIIGYSSQMRRILNRGSVAAAKMAIEGLQASDVGTDPALVPALRSVLGGLGAAPGNAARKLLVVISDGSNFNSDWNVFRAAGNRARHNKIPIFPVAFSPIDERGPMLNLGEIAKRSSGTFRWAQQETNIVTEFSNLAQELNSPLSLSFAIADRCESGHRLELKIDTIISQRAAIDAQGIYKAPPTKSHTTRIVLVVLGLLVLLTILTLVTRWMIKSGPTRPPT